MLDDAELIRLEHEVDEHRARALSTAPELVGYIDRARTLDREHERREYETLANRNFGLIMRFSRRTILLLSGLAVVLLALGILAVHLNKQGNEFGHRATSLSHAATSLAKGNSRAIASIQESRRDSIIESCNKQNRQHRQAKVGITLLAERVAPVGRKLTRLERLKRDDLIGIFVDAIEPAENCLERVAKAGLAPQAEPPILPAQDDAFGPSPHSIMPGV